MDKLSDRLYSWASEIDGATLAQAHRTAQLPIIDGHVALMPDAHLGIGATIGSVIPTSSAVIPSAVGVDQGCGMAARRLDLRADEFDARCRREWVRLMRGRVPAGLGKWHGRATAGAEEWFEANPPPPRLDKVGQAMAQMGTLGSGNHFVELAEDQEGALWILLHSGSRGAGNKLATLHVRVAKQLAEARPYQLEDRDLAWLDEGTPEFDAYVEDNRWSQAYAMENRRLILEATHDAVREVLGGAAPEVETINCHHNYAEFEEHFGRWVWVTRKGAIRAAVGDRGLIPGSMGQKSYVVEGLGNPDSYHSCSHGAGRRMSRTQARKTFSPESLSELMGDSAWQASDARALLDEHPGSYKDLDVVMRDQADLVRITHELRAVANYKGVS